MEIVFLSLGDNLADPLTGSQPTDAQKHTRLMRQAVAAEEAGFDVFQLGEHHFNHFVFSAPEVALAAMAQHTSRIRLGTGVTTITTLDPVLVAESFATVDVLSGGRAEIGVGRGAYAAIFDAMGRRQDEASAIFDESVELLWRLFGGTDVTWQGQWRPPLDGVTIRPRPVQERIPIWNSSTSSIGLSAKLGLGAEWVAALAPFDHLAPFAEEHRSAWEAAGRNPADVQIRLVVHYHVARTSQEARNTFRHYHTNYIMKNAALGLAGYSRKWLDPNAQIDREALLIRPQGDIVAFCGSPAEIVDKIGRAREVLGITGIGFAIDMGGMPQDVVLHQIDMTGADVIPAIRALDRQPEAAPAR